MSWKELTGVLEEATMALDNVVVVVTSEHRENVLLFFARCSKIMLPLTKELLLRELQRIQDATSIEQHTNSFRSQGSNQSESLMSRTGAFLP